MRQLRSTLRSPVSLVPTMGMLHHGHMSLIHLAASQSCSVVVSVYVNPTQLSPADRATYPSTLEADVEALEQLNEELRREGLDGRIEGVFAPGDGEMYPNPMDLAKGRGTHVNVAPLADGRLEGKGQPLHFIGVATVCMKLFNVVRPHKTYFGEKDYHQTVIIKRMVDDFLLDLDVVVGGTVREDDGLAVSSRNTYLGSRRRKVAIVLWRSLRTAAECYWEGEGSRQKILDCCSQEAEHEQARQKQLEKRGGVGFQVLYFALSDLATLEDVEEVDRSQGALLSGAIRMLPLTEMSSSEDIGCGYGKASIRLIDSIILLPDQTGK